MTGPVDPQHFNPRPPHNLPVQATELIGRDEEVARAVNELQRPDVRLLTLTGPAGTGKTRLAIEVAERVLPAFRDGVFFVDVAPLSDAPLVVSAVAQTLGVRLPAGDDERQYLDEWLRERELLLVLDNFEQAVAAAPQVAALVAGCQGLKVLVTSRAPLRVRWEHEFPVPPLELPDAGEIPPLDALARIPAVVLFVERARSVKPDFALTQRNAGAVAELCVRLDGLPLALELAAARSKVLAPQAILERLQGRLDLLSAGAQDRPARHHTLRAALDWSYDLLSPPEQALLRRLSIFVGGCSLDAVEAVCAGDGVPADQVLDLLAQLVDKSLVVTETVMDGDVRYRLLETIRQYADEAAGQHGEVADAGRLHAGHFNQVAEDGETQLQRPDSAPELDRMALERDNLRAALRWSTENGQTQQAVRIGTMLWEAMEHVLAEAESARPASSDPDSATTGTATPAADAAQGARLPGPLSAREREVIVLLARGFTNRQVADALVIAEGTAERHVANILNKLSLSSRAQAAVWAVEHGLLAGGSTQGVLETLPGG